MCATGINDEKMRIGLGTMRLSAGFGINFFEDSIIGVGTRYRLTAAILTLMGKSNHTII